MALICVIDDDISVREAVTDLLRTTGWTVEAFASAEEFLTRERALDPGYLLVDVGLPELSGFELHDRLCELGQRIPVVFMTGSGELPEAVRELPMGAVRILVKPFDDRELLDAIAEAGERP